MVLKRNLTVQIDDIAVSEPAKMTVKCTKNVSSDSPDFCEVILYNVSEATRSKIVESKRIQVTAGHGDSEELVFIGDIQAVTNTKKPTEWETKIIAGDGATALAQSIINKTYSSPTDVKTLMEDIARTSGLAERTEFIGIDKGTKDTLRGTTVSGKAAKEISRLCTPRDWTWNIQDETLVVCPIGKSRDPEAYKISVETGMIGSPEWINTGMNLHGKAPKEGFKIKVDVLCIPSIKPNDKIRIETKALSGRIGTFVYKRDNDNPLNDVFVVEKVTHDLDSREGNFKSTLECKKV